jgi:NADPH:quinone reductase-like Zn-dependent oxidoreductase
MSYFCGLFAIQLAKTRFGVADMVVTCSARSEELARELGANRGVDYKSASNVADELVNIINSATPSLDVSPKKFNVIVDCVGGTEVLDRWTELVEPRASGSAYVTVIGDDPVEKYDAIAGPVAYLYKPTIIGRKLFGRLNYVV